MNTNTVRSDEILPDIMAYVIEHFGDTQEKVQKLIGDREKDSAAGVGADAVKKARMLIIDVIHKMIPLMTIGLTFEEAVPLAQEFFVLC